MSLIHHAVCQPAGTESILNLFNEKQLSSKLGARKCLKTIRACMFQLWNMFWLSVWCKNFYWHKTKDDKCPLGSRLHAQHMVRGASVPAERSALLGGSHVANVWLCFNFTSPNEALKRFTRGSSAAQQAATWVSRYYIIYQHQKRLACDRCWSQLCSTSSIFVI